MMATMTTPPSSAAAGVAQARRVLLWGPDTGESHVHESVEGAAEFLGVPADAVVAAIASGELVGGWFVDWDAGTGA
jgi:hypothetical protein